MKTVEQINATTKAITTGILIGGALGFVLSTLTGNCIYCFIVLGAAIGGSTGYLVNDKNTDNNGTESN